jgi:hypothetical protein
MLKISIVPLQERRFVMRSILLAALFLVSASAANAEMWGPTWSEVTGYQWHKAIMDRRPAIVKSVDGRDYLIHIVKIDPGPRTVIIQSYDRKGFQGSNATMQLNIEPCQRYYLNAQFDSSVGPDWKPVVDYVEPIAGCKVESARN